MKRLVPLLISVFLSGCAPGLSCAETLGPVQNAEDAKAILSAANPGDEVLFIGEIDLQEFPLAGLHLTLASGGRTPATIRNLSVHGGEIRRRRQLHRDQKKRGGEKDDHQQQGVHGKLRIAQEHTSPFRPGRHPLVLP